MVEWVLLKNGNIIDEKDFPRLENPNDDHTIEQRYFANVIFYFTVKHHLPTGETFIGGHEITYGNDTYQIKLKHLDI